KYRTRNGMTLVSRLMQNPMGPRRCLAGRDARRARQTNSGTIRKARKKADRSAKHRPEGFARKVPSCGVARLVEQNERSTFVARLASEHFSCKRGSQRVLHQPAKLRVPLRPPPHSPNQKEHES